MPPNIDKFDEDLNLNKNPQSVVQNVKKGQKCGTVTI